MYSCYMYHLDEKKYEKNVEGLHAKIAEFGKENWAFDDEKFIPLEEAYVMRVRDMDEEEAEQELYLILIGDSHFDETSLKGVLYGDEETYRRYCEVVKKSTDEDWTKEELEWLKKGSNAYNVSEDLLDAVSEILENDDAECGSIVAHIF